MKRFTLILGMLAAAVAALLVIPVGTAGAQPLPSVDTGPVRVSVIGDAVRVNVVSGSIARVGSELRLVNPAGVVKDRVPLRIQTRTGQTYPVQARVAADAKSAVLTPIGRREAADPFRRPLPRPKNKGQAWGQLNYLANQNWGCASGPTAIGALIGALLFFLIIPIAIGAAIGAYIGYDNCGRGRWGDRYHGETIRAFWTWWNMPG
ncbi:hypothetical protein HUN08_14435 [Gordonia sp. X0973]|uniref:hypothetical protein n=1 Tax=Gordonia sp. X0973 TaxID=2742602 RepID=UPI000F529847|nr:hypothetical protein [Gordonia sp. X0973]QKT08263.1 hypothetical protein HUN08_14435 [Gordonia sp. X0973]